MIGTVDVPGLHRPVQMNASAPPLNEVAGQSYHSLIDRPLLLKALPPSCLSSPPSLISISLQQHQLLAPDTPHTFNHTSNSYLSQCLTVPSLPRVCSTLYVSPAPAPAEKTGTSSELTRCPQDNTKAPKQDQVLPLFSLKGKTAIVSGAGAGIGLSVAHGFAEAGANVAIWYNSNKKAVERAAEIEKKYGVKCKPQSKTLHLDGPED